MTPSWRALLPADRCPPGEAAAAEAALQALWAAASAAHPGLATSGEALAAHALARLPAGAPLAAGLAELHAGDLYLACACMAGEPKALAIFEAELVPEARAALARLRRSAAATDEMVQLVRLRLLVGEEGRAPRIAEYAGRGELRRWLRAAALRVGLNELRRHHREVPLDDAPLLEALPAAADPALALLRQRYREDFQAAFQAALATLPARAQNLLRFHHVDGLDLDRLAAHHQVHRVTVFRWLRRAERDLATAVEQALQRRLRLDPAELDSFIRSLRSQLEVSVRWLFGG